MREVLPEQFVQIDPPPYATFEEIRLDAWLSRVRAETSAAVGIAPDLLLPQRVMRDVKDRINATGGRRGVFLECLDGWRKSVLQPVLEPFLNEGN